MQIIANNQQLDADKLFSLLIKRKTTTARFNFNLPPQQVYRLLGAAYQAEVVSRGGTPHITDAIKRAVAAIASWLTSASPFGLFLCGGVGNGKTTMARAIISLLSALDARHESGMRISIESVTAKQLVQYAKAYNNPTRDTAPWAERYRALRTADILLIDDLGTEPAESLSYGDTITAATDLLMHRYDNLATTIVTSNLAPADIARVYDARLADRFREMMYTIVFSDTTFRHQPIINNTIQL